MENPWNTHGISLQQFGRHHDPGRLIMNINVQNDISDNFHFDHKAVQSNLIELLF